MSTRSPITTHVLDLTAQENRLSGIAVRLEQGSEKNWKELAHGRTNGDGRVENLLKPDDALESRVVSIDVRNRRSYFAKRPKSNRFIHRCKSLLRRPAGTGHYHVPLLLSPFGYSTYRGS